MDWIGLDASCERSDSIGLDWIGLAKIESCPTLVQGETPPVNELAGFASISGPISGKSVVAMPPTPANPWQGPLVRW